MPSRPAKKWFYSCVRSVEGKVDDPEAVCAWNWYHHMSEARRREILRGAEYDPDDVKRMMKGKISVKAEWDHMEKVLDLYMKPSDFKTLIELAGGKNRVIAVLNIGRGNPCR